MPHLDDSMTKRESVEVLEPGQRSLTELAAAANEQHRSLESTLASSLRHAVEAGNALLEAQAQVRWGEWKQWCADNLEFSHNHANSYMVFATHQEVIQRSGVTTQNAAKLLLRRQGLTRGNGRGADAKVIREQASKLASQGMSRGEIAEVLDVSPTTVWNWQNPTRAKKRLRDAARERERLKKVAEKQDRDNAVATKGGSTAEAYALIRKTLQALDRAKDAESDVTAGRYLSAAMSYLHNAEDQIVMASKRAYDVGAFREAA